MRRLPGRFRALYFTRATPDGDGPLYTISPLCVRRTALERFVALPPSRLKAGAVEQLRALEAGCASTLQSPEPIFGVDMPEHLEKARALLKCVLRKNHEQTENRIPGRAWRNSTSRREVYPTASRSVRDVRGCAGGDPER